MNASWQSGMIGSQSYVSDTSWSRLVPVIGLAIILRMVFIAYTPADGVSWGDLNVYHKTSVRLAQDGGAWFERGGEFGYRAPLYFTYLAVVYNFVGEKTYHVGQVANLLLVVISLVLLYRITSVFFGDRVALLTICLRATLPNFVVPDVSVMSEPLFEAILLGVLNVLLLGYDGQYRRGDMLVIGLLLGLAMLTREYAQGLALIVVGILAFKIRNIRPKLVNLGMVALGLVIVIYPWMWRNTVVWGSPLPLSLTSGVNLHLGNHPDATGAWKDFSHPDHVTPVNIRFGTREYDTWHREQGVRFILDDPGRFMIMGAKKVGYLVGPWTLRGVFFDGRLFPMLPKTLLVTFVFASSVSTIALWLLGIIGLFSRESNRYTWAMIILSLYTCAVIFATVGSSRYAGPILLLLLAPASQVLTNMNSAMHRLRQLSAQSIAAWTCIGILGFLWAILLAQKL